jgi:hypothetical protein
MTRARAAWCAVVAVVAVAACGASVPLVPKGPHPPHVQEFVPVAFPPPPAKVEEIPNGVDDDRCAWVDGYYAWVGRHWEWRAGRWVVPPNDCYYAPPVAKWSKSGEPELYFTPPRWYRSNASELGMSQALCKEPEPCRR